MVAYYDLWIYIEPQPYIHMYSAPPHGSAFERLLTHLRSRRCIAGFLEALAGILHVCVLILSGWDEVIASSARYTLTWTPYAIYYINQANPYDAGHPDVVQCQWLRTQIHSKSMVVAGLRSVALVSMMLFLPKHHADCRSSKRSKYNQALSSRIRKSRRNLSEKSAPCPESANAKKQSESYYDYHFGAVICIRTEGRIPT